MRRRLVADVNVPSPVEAILRQVGRLAAARSLSAYAVGGCVRDWRLGITQAVDLDVTVEGDGIEIARQVAETLGGTVTVHQQFGTASVMFAQQTHRWKVDVATCRSETYATPAAYPRVAPGTLEEDLFRRDFTINAMAVVIGPGRFGSLIDPFHGARDLSQRRLRMLHERSFLDDPSRLLRGVRFAQRFRLRWDAATLRAAREAIAAGALGWLNRGRLGKELERMLQEPNPLACFQQLASLLGS